MTATSVSIFVYGTLRDSDVLRLVLGEAADRLHPVPAVLLDHATETAAAGPYPVLRARDGQQAQGLLLTPMDAEIMACLDFFDGAYDYTQDQRKVLTAKGAVEARVYVPSARVVTTGVAWDLAAWQATDKPLFLEMGAEVMEHRPQGHARGRGLLLRGLQRLNAAEASPEVLRSRPAAGDLVLESTERAHSGFFVTDVLHYRHRRFDGAMSGPLRREVFVTGDAVTVLPWDPTTDQVLLIEQVRAGLVARRDPNPWNLEVIAGLRDKAESAEATARREAAEEADLSLGRMAETGRYYSSPGILTEFITGFIGEADLSQVQAGVHGLASEDEDIRTLILPRSEAMRALERGEARNAPLMLSLLALERMREGLLRDWR